MSEARSEARRTAALSGNRWWRRAAAAVAAVVCLAAAGVIGYRVLAPAEKLNPARRPYPPAEVAISARVGVLTSAPLIIENRLRVYAEKRRVWADTPVSSRTQMSPYWAYRRWPAQVVGVQAVESGPAGEAPVVLTAWSDGALVALDARRGRIAWRTTRSTASGGGYDGRRTGGRVVYDPDTLLLTRDAGGRAVVILAGAGRYHGFDPWTGAQRWEVAGDGGCRRAWTGPDTLVVGCPALAVYDGGTGRRVNDWQPPAQGSDGPAEVTAWGCVRGRSQCQEIGVRTATGASQWRLRPGGSIVPEPYARSSAEYLLGDAFVDHRADSYVALVDRSTGARRWAAPLRGEVIGADRRGVYVITPGYALMLLDPVDGHPAQRLELRGVDVRRWRPGYVHIHDGYLAIERLTGRPGDPDDRYYYGLTPVVLMAV